MPEPIPYSETDYRTNAGLAADRARREALRDCLALCATEKGREVKASGTDFQWGWHRCAEEMEKKIKTLLNRI